MLATLVMIATVSAAEPPPPTDGSAAETTAPAEKLICKRPGETGSRTSAKKLCLTKSQWREYDRTGGAGASPAGRLDTRTKRD